MDENTWQDFKHPVLQLYGLLKETNTPDQLLLDRNQNNIKIRPKGKCPGMLLLLLRDSALINQFYYQAPSIPYLGKSPITSLHWEKDQEILNHVKAISTLA